MTAPGHGDSYGLESVVFSKSIISWVVTGFPQPVSPRAGIHGVAQIPADGHVIDKLLRGNIAHHAGCALACTQ